MSLPRLLFVAVLPAILAVAHARADEPTSAPPAETTTQPAPPEAATTQETVVHGTLPEGLTGRWLAVSWLDVGENRSSTLTAFWQIGEQDGKPVLTELFGPLPDGPRAAFDQAGNDGTAWKPSAEDVATIRDGWGKMVPKDRSYKTVWTEIASPDGYDDNLKKDPRTKDAMWVVRQRFDASPSAAPLVRQVFAYGVTGTEDGGYTGNIDGVTVAAAPAFIPISFKGSFRFYRLDAPPPPRGFFSRLADTLRGCGR